MRLSGWHDMVFPLPEKWNLSRIEGDREKGYLRIDDLSTVRLELKWERSKKELDLEKISETYLKKLRKFSGKKNLKINKNPNLGPKEARADNRARLNKSLYLTWEIEKESKASILARYCFECKRVLFLIVFSKPDENIEPIAKDIFCSLKDHPEDNVSFWGAYDLNFRIPAAFTLKKYAFSSGHLHFFFTDGRKDSLIIDRFSLADTVLKKEQLEDWYNNYFRKDLAKYRFPPDKTAAGNGDYLRIEGRESFRLFPEPRLLKLRYLDSAVWRDRSGNKIFAVSSVTGKKDSSYIDFLRKNINVIPEENKDQ